VRLIWLGGAWLAGIVLGLGRDLGPWWALGGWLGIALLALLALFPGQWRALVAAGLLLTALGLGAWRATLVRHPPADLPLGAITAIRGQVRDWPKRGDRADTAVVAVDAVRIAGTWRGGTALVRADLPLAPPVGRGDRIESYGVYLPVEAVTPTGFRVSLALSGQHGQFRGYDTRVLGVGPREDVATWQATQLAALEGHIRRHIPGAEGALVTGVLLGDDNLLPNTARVAFAATGTSHVMALSGWNVALIAGLCAQLGTLLRRERSILWLLGSALAIWAFVLFVGASPTLVRAALMGSLYLAAEALGRRGDAPTALLAAAIAITAASPVTLLDIGFQLSCAATVGLLLGSGRLAALLRRCRLPRWLAATVAATLAADIATLPLVAHHFGRFSTVTLPANLLIELPIPLVMIGGAVTALAGPLPGPRADVCGLLAWLPARFMLLSVEALGAFPGATRTIAAPGWPLVATIYLALGAANTLPGSLVAARAATARALPGARGALPPVGFGLLCGVGVGLRATLLLG